MNKTLPQILLVEDDYMDIINVERELRKLSINLPLLIARNGQEALTLLKNTDSLPSVVMLDINMPRMNGLEFLTEIRKDRELEHLNVFITTTSMEDSDYSEAADLNVSGYIEKPLSFDTFGDRSSSRIDTFSLFLELLKLKN
ncbi:response regulator [Adhaeribacter pallidiroseus]|uniref:Putative methanoproteinis regulatory protein FilR2 n=1 Tax=Adhaeribacter pallidiroseus TaxID=2072847 RepID=A0A369QIX7_9BACT|nr:response regulator [Adhaeribacter pallidiroseus]RDC63545.1 putative methanoproteinis regulatory protein FilR2 [Adhaeribacter pallidiroseus]